MQRIPSGSNDRYVYFTARDDTDGVTFETGLSSFTVYRSRNGAAPAAMDTPTIIELDNTNMPGRYALLLDEDTTITADNVSEVMSLRITHAGMRAVDLEVELYETPIPANIKQVIGDDIIEQGSGSTRWGASS